MDKYVDGFLIPLARDKIDEYRVMAETAREVWKEHGALEYRECIGDDLEVEGMVSFLKAAGAKEGETVVFSWIVYESKVHRDKVNAAVMADPRINDMCTPESSPFDVARMAYGGFRILVEL